MIETGGDVEWNGTFEVRVFHIAKYRYEGDRDVKVFPSQICGGGEWMRMRPKSQYRCRY